MDNGVTVTLMDKQRIKRSLKRIAHQVSEDNRGAKELVILGINERGYAVAELLREYLKDLLDKEIQCRQLIVDKKESSQTELSLKNKYVLLVDDVIFSGTTMFDALNQITRMHSPEEVHTATLIDRGHRKFPIFAQFVGLDLPTKLDEHVNVELQNSSPHCVILEKSLH